MDSARIHQANTTTVTAQIPVPRKDVMIDRMYSTIISFMDRMDGFYHILMRERDILFTALSTFQWYYIISGHATWLSNTPVTFN